MYIEYNILQKATNIHKLPHYERFLFRTFENYIAVKESVARQRAMDKMKAKQKT